ncbi:hypothetical protein A9308_08990 [Moraxella atlantae]|uniref:Uncharacterized protein n=1 Tax=Faucicola atlantae TaxID=34059 RepID=A0A1B8QAE5_9GAMM|nr:TrbC/VirB2 family protein [Moraxella atlantae]OBX76261.1 hypothetical protein A9308_08990 [Moraxella atlantae]
MAVMALNAGGFTQAQRDNQMMAVFKYALMTFWVVAAVMLLGMHPAAADLVGGINKAKGQIDPAIQAFYVLVGIAATGYLLWKFLDAWQGRADWKDFGMAIVHVALAGSATVLAPEAWKWFTS